MIDNRYSITADATHEVELLLTRFERDRDGGDVDLADYFPPPEDPAYGAVVTELSRIDLEHRFNDGLPPDASAYIKAFPDVFQDSQLRLQLAFEEYRLRRRGGDDVTSAQIGSRYNVDGSHWPKMKLGSSEPAESRRFTECELAVAPVAYPSVGDTFAGYPLVSRIGEGAFSRVFLARQPDLASRLVVLKVTPLATEESDRLASLQHTAIIPVYSIHRERELSCICMPFLGATTLADLAACGKRWASLNGPAAELVSTVLERRRSTIGMVAEAVAQQDDRGTAKNSDLQGIPSTEIERTPPETSSRVGIAQFSQFGYVEALLELATGAVEGLSHAHRRGVIHRDLKPANILVSDDGSPVLLDFNLAVSSQQAKTRIVGGTLPYMSPQQLESLETGAAADPRDDVFSMGVILYELFSGRLPFACPASGEAIELNSLVADRRKKPTSIRSFNTGVSPGLAAIVERCISPEREQRYQQAAELLDDLNRHRKHLPLKHAPNRSARERLSKWSARHPRLSSASSVAAFAALILVICAMLIWQRGERISRLNVESQWQQLNNQLPQVIAALTTPGREPELLTIGLEDSSELMNQWHVGSENWRQLADVDRLDEDSQQELRKQLASLAYLMAGAELDMALQSSPSNQPGLGKQASYWNDQAGSILPEMRPLTELQRQRIESSIAGVETVVSKPAGSTTFDDLELRALWAAESGDATLWRELTHELLDEQPTNVTYWFHLALANGRLGNLDAASAHFDVCHRLQPQSIATLLNRGICNLDRGESRLAFEDFSKCIQLNPQLMVPRFNRAVAAHRMGVHRAALDDLNELIRSGRATTRMLLLRGQVHDALGDRDAAHADRRAALEIPPRDANDWVALGVSRLADSPHQALVDFKSALRIQPDHFVAIQNAAHVYAERLSQPEKAIELLSELVRLRPASCSAVASRGIVSARIGDTQSALADARTAAKLSPSGGEQLQIAGIYALLSTPVDEAKNRNQALRWLARSLRTDASLARIASADPDLASLTDTVQFQRLVGSAMAIEAISR